MQKNLEYHKINGVKYKLILDGKYYHTTYLKQFLEQLENYFILEENVKNTWSGKMFKQEGCTNIAKLKTDTSYKFNFYEHVEVLFTK